MVTDGLRCRQVIRQLLESMQQPSDSNTLRDLQAPSFPGMPTTEREMELSALDSGCLNGEGANANARRQDVGVVPTVNESRLLPAEQVSFLSIAVGRIQ